MLPVLEVSRLSSASSFYSAVTQSLGLSFLENLTPSDKNPSNSTALVKHNPVVVFGDEYSDSPVFQLRQVDNRAPHPASIVLSANSLDAVNEFHAAAVRAFPRSAAVIGTKESLNPSPEKHKHNIPSVDDYFSSSAPQSRNSQASSTVVARISDFDGNTMAVEYYPYQQSSSYGGDRSSRHCDSSRVLEYSTSASTTSPSMFNPRYSSSGTTALTTAPSRQRGTVAASEMPAYYDQYSSSRNDRMGTLRRSATSASAASYESDPSTSSSNKGGMGAFGLAAAGAVGAMAGAAFTYTVMRGRSQSRGGPAREVPYEYDGTYTEHGGYEDPVPSFQRRETAPAAIAYEPPEYAASRYSSRDNGGMRASRTRSIASQREYDDVYDYKDTASAAPPPSYHTSVRYSKAPSVSGRGGRSRSEAPVDRAPLMLTNGSEKGGFDGYDYGNNYDGYEKGGYEKGGYEKGGYEKGGYDKSGHDKYDSKYEKHDKFDKYDKRSYVSERTERSRVPPNSSRSAPLRAPTYASSHAYSQQPSQAPSRRSRSSSRSRSHAYQDYAGADSQATLVRSSSSRAPPPERAESHATLRSRAETLRSGSRSYASQSHRSDRSARGGSHARYEDDQYGDYDDDGDADSVAPDDSISCVGIRGRYH